MQFSAGGSQILGISSSGLDINCTSCVTDTNVADIALGGGTSGNYVQSIADSGAGTITVTNGVSEGGAVTLLANCTAITGSADLCDGSDATGAGGGAFAWLPTNYGVSTSTTLGFLNGFVSNAASTTFSGATTTFNTDLIHKGTYLNPTHTATVCALGCDYSNIDTAIDTVAASSTVYIKNGTYDIGTSQITLASGKPISIIGQSMDGVQIIYTGASSAFVIGDSSADTRRVRIENITLNGTSNGNCAFSFVRVKNSEFRNLRATGFLSTANPGQGFRLDGTGGYTGDNNFYNLHCDNSQFCLNLSGTAVNDNHFYGFTFRATKSDAGARAINLANANGNSFHGGLVGNSSQAIDFNARQTKTWLLEHTAKITLSV